MTEILPELIHTLPDFALFFFTGLIMLIAYMFLYVKATPYNEFRLILDEGNVSASVALASAMIAFTLPIGSVISNSVSYVDFVLWALISSTIQIGLVATFTRLMKRFGTLMKEDYLPAGIFLAGSHVSVGILIAQTLSF